MTIQFYQAECGDAARIRYIGADNKPHNLFIDSGFPKTFRNILLDEVKNLAAHGECIDLWVITHIHDDHIGGAISYIQAVRNGEIQDVTNKWLYNIPRITTNKKGEDSRSKISDAQSIAKGDILTGYLAHTEKLYEDVTSASPSLDLFGLKITFLSPSLKSISGLRNKYSSDPSKHLERIELDSISDATARIINDYQTPYDSFDLNLWKEDDSLENGSSIAMLIEFENSKTLWLSDALPSIVTESLTKIGYSKSNPLECNLVKVAHHGSKGNNSDDLYSLIRSDNYLFSANGENRYCLPTKECIIRILMNSERSNANHYNIHFTYDNDLLRSIFSVDEKDVFEKLNFSILYQNDHVKEFKY